MYNYVIQVIHTHAVHIVHLILISHGGRNDVTTHVHGKHHKEMAKASSSSKTVTSFFRPQTSPSVIEAECLWSSPNIISPFRVMIMLQNYSSQF